MIMKRRIPLFLFSFLLIFCFKINAQTTNPYEKRWLFGMNWGGAWENADVHSRLGTGFGFTLEKEIIADNTSLLGFSLRGRYLHTWMWGRDRNRFYGITNDENLNGTVYPGIDYTSQGSIYRNFYTKTDEFSLEGLLILNRLRAHSGFKIYGFGGIGATGYTTKINQLDGTNAIYDYSNVSALSGSLTRADLNTLWDNTYETNGVAGRTRSSYGISGAIGIGVGIKLSPNVYLGWEHKYTYTSTDLLDASRWNNDNSPSLKNDRYHYSNLFVTVALNGGSGETTHNQTTHQPTPAGVYKPEINLKYPTQNPFTFSDCFAEIKLAVSNITSASQITILADGNVLNGSAYGYDNESGILTIRTQISSNTTFTVIAENESGKDTKYVYANCQPPLAPVTARPEISIISAVGNNCIASVAASIKYVTDVRSIQVMMDGRTLASNQYSFDPYSGTLRISAPFVSTSKVVIRVSSNGYVIENSVNVYCTQALPVIIPVEAPPVIQTTNSQVGNYGGQCIAKITAYVTGINSANDIIITCNGALLNTSAYSYNISTSVLTVNYPIAGSNTFLIRARNGGGEVNSSVYLDCVNQPLILPPSIILIHPEIKSSVSNTCKEHIVVKVQNVTNIQNIDVSINGTSLNKGSLTFDQTTSILSFDAPITDQTSISIYSSNAGGTTSETFVINCKPLTLPTINVSFPTTEPYVSATCKEVVTATLSGITNKSSIQVLLNGLPIASGFTFDVNTKIITVPITVINRSELLIKAIGDGGMVSKKVTLICQPAPKPLITVVSPASNPVISTLCAESITAQIQHVSSINDIVVKLNNDEIEKSKCTFNAAAGILVVPVSFTGASNNLLIHATNASGTSSQSIVLECKPIVLPKPEINILAPTSVHTISKTCHEPVQLKIKNCTAVSDISVLVNGSEMPLDKLAFDTNTGLLSFQVDIKSATTVVVNAKNNSGISTTTLTFQCKPTVQPSVNILQPIGTTYISTSCSEKFLVAITNISEVSQIDASYNNALIDKSLFNYDTLTHMLSFNYAFTGNGNLTVKAKNESGEDSKIIQLQCKPVLAPQLTILSPISDPHISENCTDTIIAVAKNITSIEGIKVYLNGAVIPSTNIVFDNTSVRIQIITSYTGDKELKIVATNEAGTVTKVLHLTCAPVLQPTITLMNPITENYSSATCQENVLMTLTNITSIEQISVKINSVQVDKSTYTFNTTNGLLTIPVGITAQAVVEVTAINKLKVATKKCTIVCNKLLLPSITISSPSSMVLDNCNTIVRATLANISSKEQIAVKVNGVDLNAAAFTFENNTLSFAVSVKDKSDVIITTTNTTGVTTEKRTLVCNVSQVVVGPSGTSCENTQKTPITNCSTCNDTINVSSGTITVDANKKVCITNPFSGNVNMNGGQLVICANATIHTINFNAGDIVIIGNASFDNMNMNNSATAIRNYGTVQFSNITFNGRFENHGQATVSSDFNVNSGATFINTGTFNAKLNFNNNKFVCNSGTINISGNLKDNGSAEFLNSCKLIVGGDLYIDHTFQNSGAVKVAANTVLNGSGKLTLAGNSKWITKNLLINGSISGPSQNCASVNSTGQTTINSSAVIAGKIDICDATGIELKSGSIAGTVTTDCSCSINMADGCGINDDLSMSITICHKPAGDPSQTQTLLIPKSEVAEHFAHGDHIGPCTDADKLVTPPVVVPPVEEQQITICHKPPGNTTNTQTITIGKSALAAHLAHGDHVGACSESDIPKKEEPVVIPPVVDPPVEEQQITICHKPPGNSMNTQTITIGKSALAAHLAHGDHVGECTDSNVPKKDEPVVAPPVVVPPVAIPPAENEQITICHKPPGNPTNVQTLTISKSALSAHLAHGDNVGACTDADLHTQQEEKQKQVQEQEEQLKLQQQKQEQLKQLQQREEQIKLQQQQEILKQQQEKELKQQQQQTQQQELQRRLQEQLKLQQEKTRQQQEAEQKQKEVQQQQLQLQKERLQEQIKQKQQQQQQQQPQQQQQQQEQQQMVTICHKQGGKGQTMRVSASELKEHLAHGDHVGTCTPQEGQ